MHAKSVAAATTRETMSRKAKVMGNSETFDFTLGIHCKRWQRKTMIAKYLDNRKTLVWMGRTTISTSPTSKRGTRTMPTTVSRRQGKVNEYFPFIEPILVNTSMAVINWKLLSYGCLSLISCCGDIQLLCRNSW